MSWRDRSNEFCAVIFCALGRDQTELYIVDYFLTTIHIVML